VKKAPGRVVTVRVGWAGLLAFACFWSYGFAGAMSYPGFPLLHWGMTALLLALFAGLLRLHYRGRPALFNGALTLGGRDLAALAAFSAVMLPLSLPSLSRSLFSDQLFHSQEALRHSLNLVNIGAARGAVSGDTVTIHAAQAVNLALLLAGAALLWGARRMRPAFAIALFSVIFVLMRLFHWRYFAGTPLTEAYWSPHPPLRLFPLWLSATLLPASAFALRFAQFAGLLLLMWALFRAAARSLPPLSAWLFALAAGSIPVLWHTGVLAEQSVWTGAAWSLMLVWFASRERWESRDFALFAALLSAATLMRQSAFVGLGALGVLLLFHLAERENRRWKELAWLAVTPLVMLPFLARSVLGGTPAAYREGESALIPAGASGVERVLIAVKSGIASHAVLASVTLPWVLLFLLAFVPWGRARRHWALAAASLCLFAGGLYLFYTIRPVLWAQGRYQAEYVAPLAALGAFSLAVWLDRRGGLAARALPFLLAAAFAANAFTFLTLYRANPPADELKADFMAAMKRPGYRILSELPFPVGAALRDAKQAGLAGSVYVAGITYGAFPEILAGYTVREVERTRALQASLDNLFIMKHRRAPGYSADPELIDRVPAVRAVLISDFDDKAIREGLAARGWVRWKEWRDEAAGATVYGMVRGK
jgi:hypothetical protein